MALIDELRALFESDIRFATWDESVKIDASDPNKIDARFYTDVNEYVMTVSALSDGSHSVELTAGARKARAGQTAAKPRRILFTAVDSISTRLWRKILGNIVGFEMVRIQRREAAANMDEGDTVGAPPPARASGGSVTSHMRQSP